jgi:hypothetical protein
MQIPTVLLWRYDMMQGIQQCYPWVCRSRKQLCGCGTPSWGSCIQVGVKAHMLQMSDEVP